MLKFYRHIIKSLVVLIVSLSITTANANHLVGGTMTYECLGNDVYKIKLTVYRDCNSSTPFDVNAPIGIFNNNGTLLSTHLVVSSSITPVPIILNNPCLVAPPNVCIEKSEYELNTILTPIAGGYNISYQRCCRNANAVNIISPASMGSTYTIHIPESNIAVCNSSPIFNNPPPTTMCTGYQFEYDLSATDKDGDSLYYTFGTPSNGGSTINPAPSPPNAPPYTNIPWNSGYTSNYQIDANPAFTINPQTGFLSGTPTNAGYYTFCIVIKEYRNGILIDEINRDFLLTITNCQINTVANFATQNNFCSGTTVTFSNTSLNSTYYFWDFGDNTATNDTSILQNPSYTYLDTGIYNVMLIANPGYFCADTIYHQFKIYPKLTPSFVHPSDQCLFNNSFSMNAIGSTQPNDTITWNLGNTATPSSITGVFAQTSYPTSGSYPIELNFKNHGCTASFFDTIKVYDNPTANFNPQSIFCNGLTIPFTNNSTNSSQYFWDFGDLSTNSDTSIVTLPTYIYADSGIYNVMLIANQQNICYDTAYQTFNVYPPLIGEFSPQADQCFPSNSFQLTATGNFNNNAIINWNFGAQASPTSSNSQQANVSFSNTGFHSVHLTIQNYGCSSSFYDTLNVFPVPKPAFTLTADTGCQPFTVTFHDSSFAWTPLSYYWDFGDGNTSTQQIPTHTYLNAGIFDINLTISTDSGCIDTNTLSMPNLITVHPKPEAKFYVTPVETHFMNHIIIAEDFSNEVYQEFHFGDGSSFTDRYIEYSYLDTGHYQFTQYVINEFNCKDTAYQNIWIKPDFLFYVPNAFTPGGDGLNDIFLPQIQGIIEYELLLFNRWGELYFKSDNLNYGWDGTYHNQNAPIGVYTWKIKVKTIDQRYYFRTGHINLLR